MAQAISTRTSTSTEPEVDAPLVRELMMRLSQLVDGALPEALPPAVRTRFERRQALLRIACHNADRAELEEAVAGMMMRYPSMRGVSKVEAQVMIRAYADDLAGLPLWTITAACRDIAKGAVADIHPDFAPSAPRVRQIAQEHVERPAKELRDLRKILSAPLASPENPEMRKRVAEGLKQLSVQLKAGLGPSSIGKP